MTEPLDLRLHKCKFGCKDRTGVKQYATKNGAIKLHLCPTHKSTFGVDMVDVADAAPSIAKATKTRNIDQKARIEGQLNKQTASTEAGRLGLCEYPGCDSHDTRLFQTKSPNPITLQLKGRYCNFHVGILNSDHKVLPYRMGRLTQHIFEAVCSRRLLDLDSVALKFEVPLEHVNKVLAMAEAVVKPDWPVLKAPVVGPSTEIQQPTVIDSAVIADSIEMFKGVQH